MSISVAKYQGAGNDFVLAREVDVLGAGLDAAAFAAAVCDRHMGIGADGAILAGGEAAGGTGPVWMRYHNADGSVAPMCGNGIRCLAAYLFDEGMSTDPSLPVETLAGTKVVERISDDPFRVRVDMGRPDWSPAALGITGLDEPIVDAMLDLGAGREATVTSLFMATDHTVIVSDDAFDDANMGLGREVCASPFFPRQTNVNFVQPVTRKRLLVRTFERGVGPTLACGTGVCAAAVVAHRKGLADASVDVTVPGGELHIDIDGSGEVYMTGGATRIMRGEWFR
jgi:diaminopimelate epimerase